MVFRNELRKRVRTSHVGGSFCVVNGVGIEVLAEPIFVRGVSPSKVGTHRAWLAHLAPEPLLWRFVFCGNGEGIEALAEPIFVRGVSPFYGSGTAAPFNGSASRTL